MNKINVGSNVTNQALGDSGDRLKRLIIIPSSLTSGTVVLIDNGTSNTVFNGSAIHGGGIVSLEIDNTSEGQWAITTGSGVEVIVITD